MFRSIVISTTLAVALFAVPTLAAPKDAAATAAIKDALDNDYLATNFDAADSKLKKALSDCGGSGCSKEVLGKLHMYMGVIAGSGRADQASAKKHFRDAFAVDPAVKLDDDLASKETKETFAAARSEAGIALPQGPAEKPTKPEKKPEPAAKDGDESGLKCEPEVEEIAVRQPVPFACTTDEKDAKKVELRYKAPGSETWATLPLKKVGEQWVATTPCESVETVGTFRWYVTVKNAEGEQLDSLGTKTAPKEIGIVTKTDKDAPAFEGQKAPARCAEKVECPPDLPGCTATAGGKDWGASCKESTECKGGLMCAAGKCESASCTTDDECGGSKCVGGTCQVSDTPSTAPKSYKRHLVSLGFGLDLVVAGAKNACMLKAQPNDGGFSCFERGTDNPLTDTTLTSAMPGAGNKIDTGLALGTMRVMAAYDYVALPFLSVGGRLGFAFNGGPKPSGGNAFLPLHAEARVKLWPIPFTKKSPVYPFAALMGGLAQFDAKYQLAAKRCSAPVNTTTGAAIDPSSAAPDSDGVTYLEGCATTQLNNGLGNQLTAGEVDYEAVKLDAYKKLGQAFLGFGAGVYAPVFGKDGAAGGLMLEFNLILPLPDSALVMQPVLSYQLGF